MKVERARQVFARWEGWTVREDIVVVFVVVVRVVRFEVQVSGGW